jgi:hypothetical protein
MGTDFSSIDAPFGFLPYGPVLRANLYAVQTAPTINIYHNDIVSHGGTGLATKYGALPIIDDAQVPDGRTHLLGSVIAIFDEDMAPVKRIVATEAGDSTVAGYVMVADHPDQLYLVQEDGAGNAIDLSEIGFNVDIVSATLCAGNAYTGVSTQEIDSNSAATTAATNLQLIRPHEDDTIEDDTIPNARWIVRINEHAFSSTDGAGI